MSRDKDNRESRILQEHRRALGLTQGQVAAKAEIDLQSYQRYEYGIVRLSNATMKTGLRICDILKIDPREIVFGKEER